MRIFKLTISRKILLLVGFVSLVSGLAGILPLYLGSFVALERAFSNLLVTSTQTDASQLNNNLKTLENLINLTDEKFHQLAFDCIAIYSQHEQEKRLSSFTPRSLRNLKDLGLGYFEPLLTAAGDRGYLVVSDSQGHVSANSRDVFSINLSDQPWWDNLSRLSTTSLYYAQVGGEVTESGPQPIYLLMIKPLWQETVMPPDSRRFAGAIILALDARDLFQRSIGLTSLRQINNILVSNDGTVIFQPTGAPQGVARTIQANLTEIQNKMTGWYWADTPGARVLLAHAAVTTLRLHAHQNLSNTEWYVVEYIDISDPVAQNSLHLWRTMPLGLVLIGLLCLLGAAISYRIVKPLKNLHRGVERLRRGDLNYRVKVRASDELAELAESFNRMAHTLKETYDELEFKVRETDEKRRQLAIINEVIKSTTQALEADRAFQIIAREVGRLVPYDRMSLSAIDQENGEIEFLFVIPPQRDTLPKGYKIQLEKSLISLAVANRTPIVTTLTRDSHQEFEDARTLYEVGARSVLLVPLLAQSGIIGSMNLASEIAGQYGQREIDLIMQVADTLAVAIEHSRLYTRVAQFAEELEEKVKLRTAALENAQQKLVQTEKFAATGRLAANIAHEINNPLGIIKNYMYLLSESVEHSGSHSDGEVDAKESLRIIREEIDRIARIVRRLLDFYKRPETKPVPTDVNREIEEMFYLTRKGFKRKDVKVEKDLAADLPTIMASPDKIRQVILNLLRNAEDAVADKGWILIRTNLERRTDDRTGKTGDYVVLTVQDNGCGISPQNLRLIFDPFFTTKQESGTGLGLSITYGIVESLGGWIEVDSEEGKGTTFRIALPVEPVEIPAMAEIGPKAKEEEKAEPTEAAASKSEVEEPAAAAAKTDEFAITLSGLYDEAKPETKPAVKIGAGKEPKEKAAAAAAAEAEERPFDELAVAGLTFGEGEQAASAAARTPAMAALDSSAALTPAVSYSLPLPPLPDRPARDTAAQKHHAAEFSWTAILESLGRAPAAGEETPMDETATGPGEHHRPRTASEALESLDVFLGRMGLLFLDYDADGGETQSTPPKPAAPARSIYDELFGDTSLPKPAPPAPPRPGKTK